MKESKIITSILAIYVPILVCYEIGLSISIMPYINAEEEKELLLRRKLDVAPSNEDNTTGSTILQDHFFDTKYELAGAECLNLSPEESLDIIISKHERIYILMPAKAAGTTMKRFTAQCTKGENFRNFVNVPRKAENFLTNQLRMPSIVTSHVYKDEPLIAAAQHSSSGTLLIYVHRDETDRLISGINEVITTRMCSQGQKDKEIIIRNETHCILDEELVVKNIIKKRRDEIQYGASDILTCKAYNALKQNDPNFIFINYKQASKLQKLIAKHQCPELLNESPILANSGGEKDEHNRKVYFKLKNGNMTVPLAVWLHEKKHFLEWSLKLRGSADCQATTKQMQTALFNCPDETLRVTDVFTWYRQ